MALGAGIAGGTDVILIPEIPYDAESIAAAIRRRSHRSKRFSIVAVAEGAISKQDAEAQQVTEESAAKARSGAARAKAELEQSEAPRASNTIRLARQLEGLTSLESRVTILGYLQRGGTPSGADRLLATRLGTACADIIDMGQFGVMVAARKGNSILAPRRIVEMRRQVP